MTSKRKKGSSSGSTAPRPPTIIAQRARDLIGFPDYPTERDWSKFIISRIREQKTAVCLDTAGVETYEGRVNIKRAQIKLNALPAEQKELGLNANWETVKGDFISLSPQEAINNGKKDVSGGLPTNFSKLTKVLKHDGVCLEEFCPYTGRQQNKDKDKNKNKGKGKNVPQPRPKEAQRKGITMLLDHEESELISEPKLLTLLQEGPVAAILDATSRFNDLTAKDIYMEGDRRAEENQRLHAVTIVGYGTMIDDEGNLVHFWKIRNSYGGWADKGYTKIYRTCSSNQRSVFLKYWYPKDWYLDTLEA